MVKSRPISKREKVILPFKYFLGQLASFPSAATANSLIGTIITISVNLNTRD